MYTQIKFFKKPHSLKKQTGAALILMAFILGLGVAAYLIKTFNSQAIQQKQDEKTMQSLNDAKQALIAWSVAHQYTPGQMPWPDRNGDGNYDGSSDCVTTPFQNSYLLGQLPHQPTTSPCLDPNTGLNIYTGLSTYPGIGNVFTDAEGNRLWYAVSKNLVYDYETSTAPTINPDIANTSTWLKVLDRNGNLVSDRVAVVLMAPGAALANQDRTGVASSSDYLDAFEIGLASYNNHTYAVAANDFVMGEDYKHVPESDTTYSKPYLFNDKLVFITIDELMAALEKRVGEAARSALKQYQDTNGYYPYATQLGTNTNLSCWQNSSGTDGLREGFLPSNHQSCTYDTDAAEPKSSISCINTIFNPPTSLGITEIRYTRSGGSNFTSQSGSCINTNTTCTCTGPGTCSNNTNSPQVTCTTSGCSATGAGSLGTYRTIGDKFTSRTGGCTQLAFPNPNALTGCASNNAQISCTGSNGTAASCGDARLDTLLPAWFNQNNWGAYLYYKMTRPSSATINVGNLATEALVASFGSPVISSPFAIKGSAQIRTTAATKCSQLNEYLDSTENVNADNLFESKSKQIRKNYNDQIFPVDP